MMLFIGKGAYTPGNGNRDDDSETSIFEDSLKVRMQNGNHIISSVECIKVPTAFMVKNEIFPLMKPPLSWAFTVRLSHLYL